MKNVCLVSSNYDETISDVVVEAIDKVGWDSNIHIEPGNKQYTDIYITEGVSILRGY